MVEQQYRTFESGLVSGTVPEGAQVFDGWSYRKGGLEVVLLPYRAGVDTMAEGLAVSFFAPDEVGREVRFPVDMYTEEHARELAEMLERSAAA